MNSEESELFDSLLLLGAIEVVGIDPNNGEFMYSMTPKMEDLFPELYYEHLNKIDEDIKVLWQDGFLEINLLEDNPMVYLTSKAFISAEVEALPEDKKTTLAEIKRIFNAPNSDIIEM